DVADQKEVFFIHTIPLVGDRRLTCQVSAAWCERHQAPRQLQTGVSWHSRLVKGDRRVHRIPPSVDGDSSASNQYLLTAYRRTSTPLGNCRSSTSSRSSRTPSGKNRFPPPTTTGQTIIWNSSTRPTLIACAASPGPSTVMSRSALALSHRTPSASKSRSIQVRALRGSARLLE